MFNNLDGGEEQMDEEILATGFLAVFAGFFLVFLIVGLLLYVLNGIGFYKIAKNEGRGDIAWLAWIPIANVFLLPVLVENDVHEQVRGKFVLIFTITFVASFILGMFFSPFSFMTSIVYLYGFYFLAAKYSNNAVVHLVISIVTLGISVPFSVFRFRNREAIGA